MTQKAVKNTSKKTVKATAKKVVRKPRTPKQELNPVIVYGFLVDHTKHEPISSILRVFVAAPDVKVGDICAVWAGERLAYMKVERIQNPFEYTSEKTGVKLCDVRPIIQKIDFTCYKAVKKYRSRRATLEAALQERLAESKQEKAINDAIKFAGSNSAAIKYILKEMNNIEINL